MKFNFISDALVTTCVTDVETPKQSHNITNILHLQPLSTTAISYVIVNII